MPMIQNAIILAGGFGTRLRPVVSDVPKPLAPVGGKPFLTMQFEWLAESGVKTIAVTAHHMVEKIIEFVESYDDPRLSISVVVEDEPLGTGGAVVNAFRQVGMVGPTIVMNGDTYYEFDLAEMLLKFEFIDSNVTMAIAPVIDCARFGTVVVEDNKIISFEQASGIHAKGLVNCGLYVMNATAFNEAPDGAFSIETDFFVDFAKRSLIDVYYLDNSNAFFDIGTPSSYAEFCERFD